MDEDDGIDWRQLAAAADREAAPHQPGGATLVSLHRMLDAARQQLGASNVGMHGVPFAPTIWQAARASLPSSAVAAETVTRQDGFNTARLPETEHANWQLFCTSFVFGYGTVGYGPRRFAAIIRLTPQSELCTVIAEARRHLVECGPLSAYDYLRGDSTRRVPYWGPAFFTKLLYFAEPSHRALILDNQLAWIVHGLSGIEHLVDNHGRSKRWTCWRYGIYLAWMNQVADTLAVQPDLLEYALFLDARRRRGV